MKTRKEIKNEYKEMKLKMGVFKINNTKNNKIFVGSSTDVEAIWNRIKTELKFGSYPNDALLKEWKAFGEENFVFEILEQIKPNEEVQLNYRKELKELEKMYLEDLQPFDEKGYNKRKK